MKNNNGTAPSKNPASAEEFNYLGTPVYNPPVNLLETNLASPKVMERKRLPSETLSEKPLKAVKRRKEKIVPSTEPYKMSYPLPKKPKITTYVVFGTFLFVLFCFLTHPKISVLLDKYLSTLSTTKGVVTRGFILAIGAILCKLFVC